MRAGAGVSAGRGIEEMETRKHSSSLLRIQAYATRVRARNYFPSLYCAFRTAQLKSTKDFFHSRSFPQQRISDAKTISYFIRQLQPLYIFIQQLISMFHRTKHITS